MAHYNTFIWMVTILVIFGISSAVFTADKKDPLKQQLLGEYESGSTSAVPTDNESDLSKLKIKDEFNYVQTINRGTFASPKIKEFDIFYKVGDILPRAIREIDCNFTYDMIFFMKLMTPENYTNETLYNSVDNACSNWAQHMLNARINSGFPLREFPYTLWMYYLYTKRMKMFKTHDKKTHIKNLHGNMEWHFKWEMHKCTYLWPKSHKYDFYLKQLESFNQNSKLQKIIETCTRLNQMSESKLHFNLDLDSSLYIKNVVENTAIMNTLVSGFGGLNGRDKVVEILREAMCVTKSPSSLLSTSIHSLGDVHDYFMRMVKTIMLRICWALLNNLKSLDNLQVVEQVQTLLYKQHLNDFAILFKLNEEDDLMKLVAEISPSSMAIGEKMIEIMRLLKIYDTEKDVLLLFPNHTPMILQTVDCQTSTLVDIANRIGYNFNILSSVREMVLCAEVFVEYLKNILSGVRFDILQSFQEFDRGVLERAFTS